MMTYKSIFSGHLEFGSARSFEKVYTMFVHRKENYYRNDILLSEEEIFDEEKLSLNVPRFITLASAKSWMNTSNLLEYVAQYAIAGSINAWMINEGKIIKQSYLEPDTDKVAVQAFLKGRELVDEKGKETEAMESFNRAIKKFARHASAYERRGYVNYKLRNYKDAIYDFTKSIDIYGRNPEAYMGRANVKIMQKDYEGAIADLALGVKQCIPLQPIYWTFRRLKADCHIKLGQTAEAAYELKLFTNRKFTPDNPNYKWRKNAFFNYGRALLEQGEFAESVKAFNSSMKIEDGKEHTTEADQYLYRGIALKKAGKKGFVKDWKEAAHLGSEKAAQLLKQNR